MRFANCHGVLATLVLSSTASYASAQAFTYQLGGGSEGWPADKRAAIVKAMDEAVGVYNRFGHFEKHDTANYNGGVPTAQGSYNGTIDFGSQFSTRVAMHEGAHTLGIGTYWAFDGGAWGEESAAGRMIKLFEGRSAVLSTGGSHFWPYGLNYDNEDGPAARERHVKLVSAFRYDMGIVQDSDKDTLPDDWETFHFGSLIQEASADPDHDGIENRHEYATDCDPMVAAPVADGHTYRLRNQRGQRALSVVGASNADAAGIEVRDATEGSEQQWTVHYVGDGWFTFTNVKSGKLLAVESSDVAPGLPLRQTSIASNWTQHWRVTTGEGAEAGYFQIANRETARVVDALDGSAGTAVKQYPYLGNITQQYWRFEDLTSGEDQDAGIANGDRPDASSGGQGDDPSSSDDGTDDDDSDNDNEGEDGSEDGEHDPETDQGVRPTQDSSGCTMTAAPGTGAVAECLVLLAWALGARRRSRRRVEADSAS